MLSLVSALVLAFAPPLETGLRRVEAHLVLGDGASAAKEAGSLCALYPDSQRASRLFALSLASSGEIPAALDLASTFRDPDPDLLEEIAWGVLRKEAKSNQYAIRLFSTIGAFLTQDVRAIPFLEERMRDSNAVLRAVGLQLARHYPDARVQEEVLRLFAEEKVWMVRLEVLRALGALQMKEAGEALRQIVASDKTRMEERCVAIESLLEMYDSPSVEEMERLALSPRFGLRELSAWIAAHFRFQGAEGILQKLSRDHHPQVRIRALYALGLLYTCRLEDLIPALNDPHPGVAITAAWAAFFAAPEEGKKHLKKWLFHPFAENRRFAAAITAALGDRGADFAFSMLQEAKDPYVKVNLALGLIGQRKQVEKCVEVLFDFLEKEGGRIMESAFYGLPFSGVVPSELRYLDQIPNYPEAGDQMTRLSIISTLALVDSKKALSSLERFLKETRWGISGTAAALLLKEGGEAALGPLRELMHSKEENVRLQACLVLAMLGKDETVLGALEEAYFGANMEKKIHILEALGRIGSRASFPFFTQVLKEPFPLLRLAGASALIQSINR